MAHAWQGSCCRECEADVSWCDNPPQPANIQPDPTARVREFVAAWEAHGPVQSGRTRLALIGEHWLTLGDLRRVLELAEIYEDLCDS